MSAVSLGYQSIYSTAISPSNSALFGRSTSLNDLAKKGYTTASEIVTFFIDLWTRSRYSKPGLMQDDFYDTIFTERQHILDAHPSLTQFFTIELAVKYAYLGMLRETLTEKGAARIERLSKSLDGWDGDDGKAMGLGALANFTSFSRSFDIKRSDLGLYLNFEGKIIASWCLSSGSTIDLAFGESFVEIVTDDYELVFSANDKEMFRFIKEQ